MSKKCPECQKDIPDNAKGCPFCGYEFPKNKSSVSSTKIIAIVAIILVICIGAIFASGMFTSSNDNTSIDDNSQDNVSTDKKTITNYDSGDNASTTATVYWASAKSDKFHLPSCEWAQKISSANKIVYDSRDDAIADGKVACEVCNP